MHRVAEELELAADVKHAWQPLWKTGLELVQQVVFLELCLGNQLGLVLVQPCVKLWVGIVGRAHWRQEVLLAQPKSNRRIPLGVGLVLLLRKIIVILINGTMPPFEIMALVEKFLDVVFKVLGQVGLGVLDDVAHRVLVEYLRQLGPRRAFRHRKMLLVERSECCEQQLVTRTPTTSTLTGHARYNLKDNAEEVFITILSQCRERKPALMKREQVELDKQCHVKRDHIDALDCVLNPREDLV